MTITMYINYFCVSAAGANDAHYKKGWGSGK